MAQHPPVTAERLERFGQAVEGVLDQLPGLIYLDPELLLTPTLLLFEEGLYDLCESLMVGLRELGIEGTLPVQMSLPLP